MHLFRGALTSLVCGVLTVTLAPAVAGGAASAATPVTTGTPVAGSVLKQLAPAKKKKAYRVSQGITFNSPIGPRAAKLAINNKIIGAINHARPGSTIKIMSWNVMSASAKNALLNAQKRGVRVRVLMDGSNNDADTPNPIWRQLKAGLAQGNARRKPERRSYAKTCSGSCRGSGGAAHAKYYLFTKTGASRRVLIQGSANLTTAAALNQWNEIFTLVDNKGMYRFADGVFNQAWRDKKAKEPYVSYSSGAYSLTFSPYRGRAFKSDPVQDALNNVRCRGAVRAGNARHRTIVRSAPDVIRGKRGMVAAKRLKTLWNSGCDVRIVYTVMGKDVKKVLTAKSGRGAVPMRHLVQDFDGDGDFDNYFHIKVLTINGILGKNKSAYRSFNGSSNTSDLSTASDENIGTFRSKGITLRYQKHIDYWFDNKPSDGRSRNSNGLNGALGGAAGRMGVIDPYQNVDLD